MVYRVVKPNFERKKCSQRMSPIAMQLDLSPDPKGHEFHNFVDASMFIITMHSI